MEVEGMVAVQLVPEYIIGLSILATLGLAFMWGSFWFFVAKSKDSIMDVIKSPSFFKIITDVVGVIAATVILSLAGR